MDVKKSLVTVCLLFLFAGCDLFETKGLVTESGIAEEGLDLYFREYHNYSSDEPRENSADPELFLVMSTKKSMPCVNYVIEYEENRPKNSPHMLEFILREINLPGWLCLTAIGPAKATRYYGDEPQESVLYVKDGDYTDIFKFKITKESVVVEPIRTIFSEFSFKQYYRKPENSFYFRCRTRATMANLCQDFHEIMQNELNITEFEFPDEGFIPYPQNADGNMLNNSIRYYKYQSAEVFHSLGELLEQFTKERIAGIDGNSLSIINWRDQGYRSWMFE